MLGFFKQRFFGSNKTTQRDQPVRLTLEEFEARVLPNASPFFAGLQRPDFGNSAQFGNAATGVNDPSGMCQQGQTQTLSATLTGATGTSGSVTFNSNATTGANNLLVQVSGLAANTTFSVVSGTTTLGTIITNASGSGQLSLSNISPALTAGTTITVTDPSNATVLSGTLTASSSSSYTSSSVSSAVSSDTRISTDASTFASNLLSGNYSAALAALQDFESYMSNSQSFALKEQQALTFLDEVFTNLP